jgi:hypothetical protein
MENLHNYTSEELAKCPYHAQLAQAQNNNDEREEANTGDWDDERDEAGTDPDRYEEEEGGNDNSGGAGSSGSAATNS